MKIEIGQKFYTANGMPHIVLDITEKGIEATNYSENFGYGRRSYEGCRVFQPSEIASVEAPEITKADFDRMNPGLREKVFDEIANDLKHNGKALLDCIELWHDAHNKFITKYSKYSLVVNNYNYDAYMWIYDVADKDHYVDFLQVYDLITSNKCFILAWWYTSDRIAFLRWLSEYHELNDKEKIALEDLPLNNLLYKDGECVVATWDITKIDEKWQQEFADCIPYVVHR